MIDDLFFDLLLSFRISWWGFTFLGGFAFIVGNTLLCFIYGGRELVKKFYRDKVALLWGFVVLGLTTSIYFWSSVKLDEQLLILNSNGYILDLYQLEIFRSTSSWLQWAVWPISIIIALYNSRKYVKNKRDVFFQKFSSFNFSFGGA